MFFGTNEMPFLGIQNLCFYVFNYKKQQAHIAMFFKTSETPYSGFQIYVSMCLNYKQQ